jgi:hypothetical protein
MASMLSFPLAALFAGASLGNILMPDAYRRETALWTAQGLGQDWVDLLVVVPVLIVSATFALRGSRLSRLLLGGTLAYTAYSLVLYAFAVHFNSLFLVYAVALGLSFSARVVRRKGAPAWLNDLHRFLGALTLAFTAVHLAGLWADTYVHFGPAELFVPMASAWRPGAVAWGVAAAYLLVAVELSSLAMRRLPRRLWHTVHLSSLGLFGLGTVHLLQAGTDTNSRAAVWAVVAAVSAVGFLTLYRALTVRARAVSASRPVKEMVEAA